MCTGCDPGGQDGKVPTAAFLRVDRGGREWIGCTGKNLHNHFLRLHTGINLREQTESSAVADTLEELGKGLIGFLDLGSFFRDELVEIVFNRVDRHFASDPYVSQASLFSMRDNLECRVDDRNLAGEQNRSREIESGVVNGVIVVGI